ncbi:MAG TPA: glycosyltransferase family 2 protein, partial [Candidatus Udaeobacter sp.]|nr:glycosyltransferase family 2 protein [Candidatus Udaeobacter sp.]
MNAAPRSVPLSVLVITLNEAHNLPDCLASVPWADDLLVIDSGSTDGTPDLARAAGARVVEHPFVSAGHQRNWALPLLRHPWCLVVDADERVTPELAAEIQRVVLADGPADGYAMPRRSFFLGTPIHHSGWGRDRVLRLFRRERGRYDDALVHESLELDGRRAELRAPLLHYTYRTLD